MRESVKYINLFRLLYSITYDLSCQHFCPENVYFTLHFIMKANNMNPDHTAPLEAV